MQRAIDPEQLLRLADELGYRGAPAGRPQNVKLRRAVSTAYYAVFHHVVMSTCQYLLPTCNDRDRQNLARHIQHEAVRKVCDWVISPSNPPTIPDVVRAIRASAAIGDVALAFVTLQEARFRADYDHLADFSKPETLTLIDQGMDAVRKLDRARRTQARESFFACIALKSSLREGPLPGARR